MNNETNTYEPMGEVIEHDIDIMESHDEEVCISGVPSGYADIDMLTYGWQKGNFIVLASEQSVGKSALALNMARNAAVDFGFPVGYFCLEMTEQQLSDRLIALDSGLTVDKTCGREPMSRQEQTVYDESVRILTKSPLYLEVSPAITIDEIIEKAGEMVRYQCVRMIIVDYLQLIQASVVRPSREQEIADITRALKAAAMELDIPIIVLSQVNNIEEETGQPIFENASIEQDADMLLLLHKTPLYPINRIKLSLLKNRNGRTGSAELIFNRQNLRFHL